MNNSNFWLTYEPEGKFNLLELANTQRAITNFVKILTEKEIKVDFHANNDGDSMTNGKRITISSTISMNTIMMKICLQKKTMKLFWKKLNLILMLWIQL